MSHALYLLDNQGYRHTLRISNTYCFSTATMVTRTLLIVTFILPLPVLFTLLLGVLVLCITNYMVGRSQWPHGLGLTVPGYC